MGNQEAALVDIDDVARLAEALAGVRRTAPKGLAEWRYHGRLVARQQCICDPCRFRLPRSAALTLSDPVLSRCGV